MNRVIIGIAFAVLVIGLMGCTIPDNNVHSENQTAQVNVSQEKVNEIKQLLEDIFYLQVGQKYEFTFKSSDIKDDYVVLNFESQGREVPVIMSKDLKYVFGMLQEPRTVEDWIKEVNAAKAQLKDRLEQINKPPEIANKSDKPIVDLYVMSYCPFGLQAEKAMLPVMKLLSDKAEFNIKFVSYAMHPQLGEVQENTRQYCIQKEQNDKYWDYLNCFVEKGNADDCIEKADIDRDMLDKCINQTNEQYGLLDELNDKSKWLNGRYPKYPIYDGECNTYGVGGSPTLVINGQKVSDNGNRSPEFYKKLVCASFVNPPKECNETLSEDKMPINFGYGGEPSAAGSCG